MLVLVILVFLFFFQYKIAWNIFECHQVSLPVKNNFTSKAGGCQKHFHHSQLFCVKKYHKFWWSSAVLSKVVYLINIHIFSINDNFWNKEVVIRKKISYILEVNSTKSKNKFALSNKRIKLDTNISCATFWMFNGIPLRIHFLGEHTMS